VSLANPKYWERDEKFTLSAVEGNPTPSARYQSAPGKATRRIIMAIVCPVCTAAVAGGAGLCRWLGIDDTVSGVWIGGLLASLTLWLISWLDKRAARLRFLKFVSAAAVLYLSAVLPLYQLGIMGDPFNKIFGVDKLFVGIAFGSVTLLAGNWLYFLLKKTNDGRVYFPFQKVVVPVLCLAAVSGIFYLITC
jgi:hypothetical protein